MINEAVEKGIPVVTLINDNTQSARCSFVGLGGYNIGREYGSQITEIINSNINNVIKAKTSIAVLVNSSNQGAGQNITRYCTPSSREKQKVAKAAKEYTCLNQNGILISWNLISRFGERQLNYWN